jgi:hypothetical protein
MREFEAKEMHKRINRNFNHRFGWKPEIDFQVVSELMTYCDAKGFRMNDQRWILLPRFEAEKQRVKTSNSILSDLKQITNGRTRANWEPDAVDIIDAVAGFRLITLMRHNVDRGRVEWNTDENPKWERLSLFDDSDSGSD